MTKKRFHKGDWSNNICEVYDDEDYIGGVQLNCADGFINLLNSLNEENEQLKSELQKIYEIATVLKVRNIVEEVYDDLLYETSDESDYARKNVLKCLEKIDLLRDDLE